MIILTVAAAATAVLALLVPWSPGVIVLALTSIVLTFVVMGIEHARATGRVRDNPGPVLRFVVVFVSALVAVGAMSSLV